MSMYHTHKTVSYRIAYQCSKENQNQRPSMICNIQEDQEPKSIDYKIALPTELWGSSTSGYPWSLLLDNNKKLRKMTIDHEEWIFSIGCTIEDSSGSLISSQHGGTRGGSGREFYEISFDADEEIIEISGTVGVTIKQAFTFEAISSLCIVTNKSRHGPFGRNTGNSFSVAWVVGVFAGFHGRADIYMGGLGFYSKKVV
ncbi:putative jacalin-like lectin domain-containing protein [Helianthus anomalus]